MDPIRRRPRGLETTWKATPRRFATTRKAHLGDGAGSDVEDTASCIGADRHERKIDRGARPADARSPPYDECHVSNRTVLLRSRSAELATSS
mmetsp:Transcript_9430/g.33339  ORF Transcript_9430/g.33339 Transcript_9430/m.33339 type:complete len:92 (-) Transcript_9430:25-300(-)